MSSRVNNIADHSSRSPCSRAGRLIALGMALTLTACATSSAVRNGESAERAGDYDRAVVEYTRAIRKEPDDRGARLGLQRVKVRASQEHFFRGRRLARGRRFEEALAEFQLAAELNPTDAAAEAALRDTRQRLRTKVAVSARRQDRAAGAGRALPDAPAARSRSADRYEAAGLAGLQPGEQPRRLHRDRAIRRRQPRLRSGLPRVAHQRRPAQRHAGRGARLGDGEHTHVLPGHGAEDDHDHSRHTSQASRVRRIGRRDVLPEQRRHQGSHRPACGSSWTSGRSLRSRPVTRSRSRTRLSGSRPRAS